ncbi:hypothetical protein ACFTWH_06840 [Streptomyces sp. NPDC057011]|uniref:hypothetical protein n=1 Tax=unclassified Streptomyces TaxID=2593676 RepID=UPI00364550EF
MGFTKRSLAVMAAGAALTAALTTPAGAAGQGPAPAGPTTTGPNAYCGTGSEGGLAVHTKDKGLCSTALKVAKAFDTASRKNPGSEKPVIVRVNGDPWKCESREGHPNPYIECINQNDPGSKFELNS